MKVLVIGSGGREHTLTWKLAQSNKVSKIYCVPGNGGISQIAECVSLDPLNFSEVAEFAKKENVDLTVVGPEVPLVAGIVDFFRAKGLRIFGPNMRAAQMEGSKVFAKNFMKKYNIPAAEFEVFENSRDALDYVEKLSRSSKQAGKFSCVVKADGLAAGKGAIICGTKEEAMDAVRSIMEDRIFGDAGNKVIIEEKLEGEEASLIGLCDGETIIPTIPSQDHKPVFDQDRGPNTGGMGAYAPAPVVTEEVYCWAEGRIFNNFLKGVKAEGIEFKGVVYAGIMVTSEGPKVLEFNVRFGDPENQAVLPLLKTDLVDLLEATIDGKLKEVPIEWEKKSCVCVVVASGGYPMSYEKGKEILGLDKVGKKNDVYVFHAGTKKDGNRFLTSGGRVMGVTGWNDTLEGAIDLTYEAVKEISFEGMHYRRDIGAKGLRVRKS
ncbi:MAG TPA: phosphoribosylamine--glycine ligase [bacterium]|nr:phosphoribosylamine--glycine ligase [bacterium]